MVLRLSNLLFAIVLLRCCLLYVANVLLTNGVAPVELAVLLLCCNVLPTFEENGVAPGF